MPTDPMIQPGAFGSIRGITIFYPFKFYRYWCAFEALFFIALTLIMIVPNFIVIASDFGIFVTDFHIRISITIGAFIIAVLCIYYFVILQAKLVLTEDGIFYGTRIYRIYSPWRNVIGVENTKYILYSLKGLKLNKEFQQGPTIEEGWQQGFPVFEYTKPVYAKRYPLRPVRRRVSFFPWTNIFPLIYMSNKKRVKKKLIVAICLYAPHILPHQIN